MDVFARHQERDVYMDLLRDELQRAHVEVLAFFRIRQTNHTGPEIGPAGAIAEVEVRTVMRPRPRG